MYHVLLPVDADGTHVDRQLEATLDLPRPIEVTLLHVHEEIDAAGDEGGSTYIDDVNESLEEIQGPPETLDRAAAELADADVAVDVRRVVGDPADSIMAIADEVDADAIALAGRKRSPVGKALFGSVTQSVILEGDRTVLVAP